LLANYGDSNLAPTTINLYKGLFNRILMAMGHIPIDQIKPLHLVQFYKNFEEDGIREDGKPGLSPQRILHHHINLILVLLEQEDIKYKVLIILALETGCRKSELLGLEWSDINFKEKIIYVGRASQHTKEKGIFTKGTKNKASKRSFTISDQMILLLSKYKKLPATPNTRFQKFLKRNNLPKKRFHSLRHTNATLLIAENVDPRTVMNRLGQTLNFSIIY
jgi:integrase